MKKLLLGFGSIFLLFGGFIGPTVTHATALSDIGDAIGDNVDQQWDSFVDQIRYGNGYGNSIPDGQFDLAQYRQDFDELGNYDNVRPFIRDFLNWTLTFLGLIAVAMIIYAGWL